MFDYRFHRKARQNVYEMSTTKYCIAEAGEVTQFDLEIWLDGNTLVDCSTCYTVV